MKGFALRLVTVSRSLRARRARQNAIGGVVKACLGFRVLGFGIFRNLGDTTSIMENIMEEDMEDTWQLTYTGVMGILM